MGGLCDGRDTSVDKGVSELDGVVGVDEVSEDGKEVDKGGEGDKS
jgi:hypothetical protein